MSIVYAVAHHAVSALGPDVSAHWQMVSRVQTGIRRYEDAAFSAAPFWASMPDPAHWQMISARSASRSLTAFERLAFYSASRALQETDIDPAGGDTAFILSTTKGNIELLGREDDPRLLLSHSAGVVAEALGITTVPLVVSHACVSGVIALQYGLGLIRSGRYRNVVVTGCDRFSRFVLSGFQSFQAVAGAPCRPFDAERKGINLGEAAATIILSAGPGDEPLARLVSGATSNDANHISGPSRTGAELAMAIHSALQQAGIAAADIGMISAHGTATVYNDEMEAKAFGLAGLQHVPVHSLKGFTGHTLGAAGILESVLVIEGLRHQQLIPSPGYGQSGVSVPLNVTRNPQLADIRFVLKTASGFGGSNAAIVWQRLSD